MTKALHGTARRGAWGLGILSLLIALVGGTSVALSALAAPPTWIAPPEDISLGTALSDLKPQVAVASDGSATAVWIRSDTDPSAPPYVQSSRRPAGGDWSPPVRISPEGLQSDEPQVAVAADGTVTAIWVRLSLPRILQAATRPVGGPWSDPVTISSSITDIPNSPHLAVDAAGTATVVWTNTLGESTVRANTRSGGTWSGAVTLSSAGSTAGQADVATDAVGHATAVWVESRPASMEVVTSRKRASNGSWAPVLDASALSAPGTLSVPDVAVNSGGAQVVVWRFDTGTTLVVQSASAAEDGGWSAPATVSATGADDAHAAQGGRAAIEISAREVAVWLQVEPSGFRVVRGSFRQGADPWPAPGSSVALSALDDSAASGSLSVSSGGGATTAVWAVGFDVVQASTLDASGSWSPPEDLSGIIAPGLTASAPQVARDAAGNAAVVWRYFSGPGTTRVQGIGLDGAAPVLSNLSVPATGFAVQAVAYSVTTTDVWSPATTVWDFGDGTTATGTTVNHVFPAVGTYPVSVTATDALGNVTTSTPANTVVSVAPPTPTPTTTPTTAPTSTPTPTPKPVLTGVKLTKKAIHVVKSDESPRATELKLTLNTDATVKVKLKRTQKIDGKAVKAKLSKALKAGGSVIKLTSTISGTKLPPGTYKVTVFAKNAVGTSLGKTLKLKILK